MPAASPMAATQLVTVLLPLVPVMATSVPFRKRLASSTSLQMGTPARSAASSSGSGGTPGESTISDAPVKSASSWPPRASVTPAASSASAPSTA